MTLKFRWPIVKILDPDKYIFGSDLMSDQYTATHPDRSNYTWVFPAFYDIQSLNSIEEHFNVICAFKNQQNS